MAIQIYAPATFRRRDREGGTGGQLQQHAACDPKPPIAAGPAGRLLGMLGGTLYVFPTQVRLRRGQP